MHDMHSSIYFYFNLFTITNELILLPYHTKNKTEYTLNTLKILILFLHILQQKYTF